MKLLIKILMWVAVLFFVLLFLGGGALIDILVRTFAGWLLFLFRVLPQLELNSSSILFTILVSGLILGLIHWLGRTLFRPESGRVWSWRWTFSFYGAMWVLFLTAMSVTGVVHQSAWLAASERKWFVSPIAKYAESSALINLTQLYMNAAAEHGDDPQKAWEALPELMRRLKFQLNCFNHAEFVPVVRQGVVESVLVIPRKREVDIKVKRFFILITKEGNYRLDLSQLDAALLAAKGEGEMPKGNPGLPGVEF